MNRMPQPGEIYQHFKGNLYRIVTLAEHTETAEMMVVYQALYGEFRVYVRPLSMFVSKVDREKYPDAAAEYRFTLVPLPGTAPVASAQSEVIPEVPASQNIKNAETCEKRPAGGEVQRKTNAEQPQMSEKRAEAIAEQPNDSGLLAEQEEFQLDPGLLAFLEAETYEQKLEVFVSLYGKVTESMLNTMAVSLDLELSGDSLEEQYDALKNCLLMLERYECNRLR